MAAIELTSENFEQEVLQADKTVLVDFWASWCGPCKMLSPVIEEIADERSDIKFWVLIYIDLANLDVASLVSDFLDDWR